MLNSEEKRELLRIARDAIRCLLEGEEFPMPSPARGALAQPSGAFVTIRIAHDLRGCIGYIESTNAVADVVADVAVKAAFEDPRFPPLTIAEFKHVTLEVSVLTPLRAISDISEIKVGEHGLLLELGHRRGLLLPQVAVEYGWDREEFLANVSRKAGLPRDAWRDPKATIYIFSAEIVGEEATVS
jgi:AmmeMemoRadiSam system protein A